MKLRLNATKTAAGLLARLLAVGPGPAASRAENWPKETLKDAAGNTYKQVRKQDGTLEVWQFIGIYGSPKEALELVGISEENGSEENGSEEKASVGDVSEGKGKKGKAEIGGIPYKYELKKREDGGKAETGVVEARKKKRKSWRRPRLIRRVIPVESINWGYNQIYLQDNRGSGR